MSTPAQAPAVQVLLRRLDDELPVPSAARADDAGVDLHAREGLTLAPGERALVPTGVALALPPGHAGFVHPRSGLAARHGITVVNAPGTVDAGYRGEILVNLLNTDPQVPRPVFEVVDELPASERGEGGHGSTGTWGARATTTSPVPDPDPKD